MILIRVIEDDAAMAASLAEVFGDVRDHVRVSCRHDLLSGLRPPEPDVILLDLGLPDGGSADAVIRHARSAYPQSAIVVHTGTVPAPLDQLQLQLHGADEVLVKGDDRYCVAMVASTIMAAITKRRPGLIAQWTAVMRVIQP